MNLKDITPRSIVSLTPTPDGPRPVTLDTHTALLLSAIEQGRDDDAAKQARELAHCIGNVVGFRKF